MNCGTTTPSPRLEGMLPFRLGATSDIILDDTFPNLAHLREQEDDVELVLFESAPRLALARSGAGFGLTLSTAEGARYQLQSTSALGEPWQDVGAPFIGTGGLREMQAEQNPTLIRS